MAQLTLKRSPYCSLLPARLCSHVLFDFRNWDRFLSQGDGEMHVLFRFLGCVHFTQKAVVIVLHFISMSPWSGCRIRNALSVFRIQEASKRNACVIFHNLPKTRIHAANCVSLLLPPSTQSGLRVYVPGMRFSLDAQYISNGMI